MENEVVEEVVTEEPVAEENEEAATEPEIVESVGDADEVINEVEEEVE